mmetsp:Transcript_16514/g.52638  ORF Transcript_16514/g.52638 Transcript_16514/m.52638 type:complete len:507 (-) Transcript_16514:157-1677(-)
MAAPNAGWGAGPPPLSAASSVAVQHPPLAREGGVAAPALAAPEPRAPAPPGRGPAMGSAPRRTEEELALALKVMRLYKPRAVEPGLSLGMHGLDMRSWTHGRAGLLLLPGSFGKIYIGQVFSCYISVCNNGLCPEIRNVQISAEFEANGNRTVLCDKRQAGKGDTSAASQVFGSLPVARPGDTVDLVVDQELASIGLHSLRVIVQFDSFQVPGRRSIRKTYRFDVAKPLSFVATFAPLPAVADDVVPPGADRSGHAGSEHTGHSARRLLGQVTVNNLTNADLVLGVMELLPAHEGYRAVQIGQTSTDTPSGVAPPILLAPGASRNFVFLLEPKPDRALDRSLVLHQNTQIGRVMTRWTTDLGEQGRLMSQPLVWKQTQLNPGDQSNKASQQPQPKVLISVASPKELCQVGRVVQLAVQITNMLDASLNQVELRVDPHQGQVGAGVLLTGSTVKRLGALGPRESASSVVHALPLAAGLHRLAGISVFDAATGREYFPETPPSIFVPT